MSNHITLPGYILAEQVWELSYLDGIQEKITSGNKLSADLIEDGTTNKIPTAADISRWDGMVSKEELSAQSYITSIPEEFITQAELSANGYLASVPDNYATKSYVGDKFAELVGQAPETLDTLNELAAALGNDPNFATTVSNQIGTKVSKAELDAASYVSHGDLQLTLGSYASHSDLQSMLASYVTSAQLTSMSYVSHSELGSVLASYVTSAQLAEQSYVSHSDLGPVLASYVTSSQLAEQSYVTSAQLVEQSYVTHSQLVEQSYVSHNDLQLTLGSYVTSDQLSEQSYAKQSYVASAYAYIIDNIVQNELVIAVAMTNLDERITALDTAGYVTQASLSANTYLTSYIETDPTVPAYVKAITQEDIANWNAASGADTDYVTIDELVAQSYLTEHQSLADYLTKEELSAQAYLQAVPSEYVTQAELSANSYLTEHQSLDAYPTKAELSAQAYLQAVPAEYVTQAELSANAYLTEHQSLAAYPTKAELSAQAYLQSESDPTIPAYVKNITEANITSWNNKVSNVQSDWEVSDSTSQAYINNKPEIPTIIFRQW